MNVRIYIHDQYIRIFEYSNIFVTLWTGGIVPWGIVLWYYTSGIVPWGKYSINSDDNVDDEETAVK